MWHNKCLSSLNIVGQSAQVSLFFQLSILDSTIFKHRKPKAHRFLVLLKNCISPLHITAVIGTHQRIQGDKFTLCSHRVAIPSHLCLFLLLVGIESVARVRNSACTKKSRHFWVGPWLHWHQQNVGIQVWPGKLDSVCLRWPGQIWSCNYAFNNKNIIIFIPHQL